MDFEIRGGVAARRWAGVALWGVLVCLPVFFWAFAGWSQRWISDDGFINLTVARHVLEGDGPVFNLGERVEAHTSAAWVYLLALGGGFGVRLERVAVTLGWGLSIAGVVAVVCGNARLIGLSRPWRRGWWEGVKSRRAAPLGMAVFVCLPPAWDHATAGLELGLTMAWLGGGFWALARLTQRVEGPPGDLRGWRATAWWLGLGPLVRPDLAIFSLGLLVPLVIGFCGRRDRGRVKGVLWLAVCMGALPVGYQIFRMGYYAALVPNTAFAKEAFESRWEQGFYFSRDFFDRYALAWPLGCLALFISARASTALARRRWMRAALVIMTLLCSVAHCVYVIKVGGGFMHGRLLLPGVFGLLMSVGLVPLASPDDRATLFTQRTILAVFITIWAVVVAGYVRVPEANAHGIGDERRWYVKKSEVDNPVLVEDYDPFYFYTSARALRDAVAADCPGRTTDPRLRSAPQAGPEHAPGRSQRRSQGSVCRRVPRW